MAKAHALIGQATKEDALLLAEILIAHNIGTAMEEEDFLEEEEIEEEEEEDDDDDDDLLIKAKARALIGSATKNDAMLLAEAVISNEHLINRSIQEDVFEVEEEEEIEEEEEFDEEDDDFLPPPTPVKNGSPDSDVTLGEGTLRGVGALAGMYNGTAWGTAAAIKVSAITAPLGPLSPVLALLTWVGITCFCTKNGTTAPKTAITGTVGRKIWNILGP